MDDARYRIRSFTDADFEAESRMWGRINPELPVSADELRHWDRSTDGPGLFKHLLAAEDRGSGELVGTASMNHAPFSFDPDRYWVGVGVDPAHEGRGIGLRLSGALEEVAVSRRAKGLWSSVRADRPRRVRFFERAGFIERRRTWFSRLDLTTADLTESARPLKSGTPEGIEFTTVAQEGPDRREVRERMYRLYLEAGKDVPRMGPRTAYSFEQFLELEFGGPAFFPEGIFVARVGEEYVGVTALGKPPSAPDTLNVEFTGTLRAYRGRGIATEIKRRSVEFAHARGYHYLRTANDSLNRPILAINEKLGFRPEITWIQGEKELVQRR